MVKWNSDQPIEAQVTDGRLQITVGIDLMIDAVLRGGLFFEGDLPQVTSKVAFAEAIAAELMRESCDDGSTLLTRAFDRAAQSAVESGCPGIVIEEDGAERMPDGFYDLSAASALTQ